MKKILLLCPLILFVLACGSLSVVKTNYANTSYQKGNNVVYYYLPETLIEITATIKVNAYYINDTSLVDAKVTNREYALTTKNIADTKHLLVLEHRSNRAYSDDLTFNVSDKGLLETLRIETDDKLPDIIRDLSKALDAVSAPIIPKFVPIKFEIRQKEYVQKYVIRASEIDSIGKLLNFPISVLNEKKVDKTNGIPLNDSFRVKTNEAKTIPFDFDKLELDKSNKTVDGIMARPIKNLPIFINPLAEASPNFSSYVQIADVSKLIVIPITRTPFAKTTNNLTMSDGILRNNTINKPSSINGFTKIPINIAQALVSIPAQLIQIKINTQTKSKELVAAESLRIVSERSRLDEELKTKLAILKINKTLDSLKRVGQ